jgi:phosphatidylserine/phosphatidylglycerophosphate/cardiolipin synthase-like enzyme
MALKWARNAHGDNCVKCDHRVEDNKLNEQVCDHVHVATLRFGTGPDRAWPDGTSFANHAKTVIVDGKAFYVGSHNFYPMNLQEYGLIVDDPKLTEQYISEYWEPLWRYSKGTENHYFCQ